MITGIGHVAFYISNLEKSLDFYCQKLGFREAFRLDREGTPSPWIVYIQVAPGNFIELFPGGAGENRPRGQNVGYNHVCLLVDDINATLQELKGRGVEIVGEPIRGWIPIYNIGLTIQMAMPLNLCRLSAPLHRRKLMHAGK
ncbi:VOC family protein [Dictyobacter kobayashii]|uniref:VOC domain-containing protein n=1 Tax=Dictyobacter kobayashii TaxID=2014872 RepID=A0A402AZC9_9CHLR|nr:VOC family protein [Dictyobacter kobayashii]GCE24423.1 hypothetical protein KDK_82230 [Dictyobacter kobayashii]